MIRNKDDSKWKAKFIGGRAPAARLLKGIPMTIELTENFENIESAETGERTPPAKKPTIVLEVSAAYNRENLPMPRPNGPNGRRVLSLEMLLHHPFYWEWLNERETGEVLMELYVTRTRRAQ